ncbi:MAG: hypothetical protein DRO05_00650 [Thermoproteota archaeon]|nr:MAG: hypothetical protein DRO05_00650 [Candidatus Korarchaeota archaeon]
MIKIELDQEQRYFLNGKVVHAVWIFIIKRGETSIGKVELDSSGNVSFDFRQTSLSVDLLKEILPHLEQHLTKYRKEV